MKIVSLFGRRTLEPSWTYTPNANIWRLLPTDSGEFIGEARNQDEKRVSFFALKGDSGAVLWQDLTLDEPWWAGIEDSSDGVVLLHKFASPDMPQHKGIIALDLLNGTYLWENQDLTFWFARAASVFALKPFFEKRLIIELDLRSGQIKREYDQEADLSFVRNGIQHDSINNRGLVFPEILDLESIDSPTVRLLRDKLPMKELIGNVEYLITTSFLAANYHVRSSNSAEQPPLLDNCFKILDIRNGKTVYEEVIARGSRGAVPDCFFLRNGTAYFIKDQKLLTAIRLVE